MYTFSQLLSVVFIFLKHPFNVLPAGIVPLDRDIFAWLARRKNCTMKQREARVE